MIVYSCIAFLFYCICFSFAQAAQLYVDDEVDLSVLRQEKPPTGIANNTNLLVINALKKELITLVPASYKRALRAMHESEDAICVQNRIKTPSRLSKFLFSLPINIYLSHRLYQHKQAVPLGSSLLNADGEVESLANVFYKYKSALIVLTPSMSYGDFLDKQVRNIPGNNKVLRDGTNHYDMTFHMFKRHRADFYLGFPAAIFRHLQNNPTDLRAYDIAGSPKYVIGHWMCNDTEQSRLFLQKLDKAITQTYQHTDFYHAHLRWLPETAQLKTKAYLDNLLRVQGVTPPTITNH
ncbi:hypothetical protein PSECIP111951_04021 [Pseudoalteromonas holothuriae]|uniref:Solute-binding protein family 3/N-terminal domain-containing protein n=1 Tax=Pseudoalteromonas holothuriae TaxID=2963714 RepID=A0A9W4R1A6_9GAMM|nr:MULTISPECIES: hypothetical protein [unclassified Pseudoalteromonas]CAH9062647.1 hypothetical protein PSECIP111854_03055 [Pseudoalteromonas sp. CIP111854]CAH9068109.1 hypothetical protein PSECIP111951_04021 [Pseudoalteromonas sp. CIP111951]